MDSIGNHSAEFYRVNRYNCGIVHQHVFGKCNNGFFSHGLSALGHCGIPAANFPDLLVPLEQQFDLQPDRWISLHIDTEFHVLGIWGIQ
jgi:hypothetical protein